MSTENQVTPAQALSVLNIATNPANAGKLSRADYANIEVALQVLDTFIARHQEPAEKEKKPETPGAFGKSKPAPKP